jgi:predicted nucleotide-binding protein
MKYEPTASEEYDLKLLRDFQNAVLTWDRNDVPDRQHLRSWINQNLRKVKQVVARAGCAKAMTISPPPAVGGMIMRGVDPFDMIFNRPYFQTLVPVVSDIIDETIGVIESGSLQVKKEAIMKPKVPGKSASSSVFVVHGRDNEAKLEVARVLEKVGLQAVVLHEQPSRGKTIIEKIEHYSDVGFAVVLLTPDDVGALATEAEKLNQRARQNVIAELGYMVAKLGRERVCALVKGGVELPSDFDGVVYVTMDSGGAWKLELGRELKAVGMRVDLNKLA